MFHVEILSGYAICSAGSLVGAVMLRMAETHDGATRQALSTYGWGLLVLGVAVLPAGLEPAWLAHPLAQWTIGAGTLASVVVIARALAQLQGRAFSARTMALLAGAAMAACALALGQGLLALGRFFAVGLALASSLASALTWRMAVRPRDFSERVIGGSFVALAATAWLRVGFTLAYEGPARIDLLYTPQSLMVVFAVLYGVIPLIVTASLLNLVNARLRQQLRHHALTDELTGAMSRRAVRELAPALLAQERSRGRAVAVLLLDLDRFKRVNDTHGHAMGDRVLVLAAAALQAQMRQGALLARYGGEEFVAVVPVADLPAARRVAERLRLAVEQVDWARTAGLPEGVTVSIGVALVGPADDLDSALARADEALYRAKREGRNQCQVGLAAA